MPKSADQSKPTRRRGLELTGDNHPGHYDRFTHWMDLPDDPEAVKS